LILARTKSGQRQEGKPILFAASSQPWYWFLCRLLSLVRIVHHSRGRRSFFPVCLLALFPLFGCDSGSRPSHIGKLAPDFTLQDTDHKVTLSQFRGQIIVLNFWASWCPPCVEELPSLINMQGRMKEKGVTVLAVSIDVDADTYHRFIEQHRLNLLTIRDPEQKSSSLYGTFGWPETYIIDRDGVVRRKLVGPVDWNSPEITEFLARL
jgi:cytochrome c biogenesis protein CcmG/thiol:disulfide interchange protein DsbE